MTKRAAGLPLQFLQDVGLLFRTVNFNFREQVDRALREGGVTLTFGEASALGILRDWPGVNGAQIARRAMVSPQAMNGVLRALMSEGFVDRRDHPGSLRADAWHLSAKGERMLARAGAIFGAVMSRMLSSLSATEQREFERCLRLCAASLEAPAAVAIVSEARRETSGAAPKRRSSSRPTGSDR